MLISLMVLTLATQDVAPKPRPPVVKQKQICRVMDKTGSRLGSARVCHTQAEWDQLAAQQAENVRVQGQHETR